MKYMLLIYSAENCWTDPEREACMKESMAIGNELAAEGKFVASAPLHSVMTATSLRIRDGKRLVTDGPFAETTEQLGGYYIIDVENLDEAMAIASRLPPAKKGTVEIRPVFDVSELQMRSECEIVTRRDLPFSQDEIFAAFSDPDRLARWWGPAGFSNTFHEFHFAPGGEWNFVMHGPDGQDYDNQMVFESIDAPNEIVLNHVCAPVFRASYRLIPLSENTTHLYWVMRFEDPETRERLSKICVPANEQNLDRLTAELDRVPV